MALPSEPGLWGSPMQTDTGWARQNPPFHGRDTHLRTGVPATHQQRRDGLGDGVANGRADVVVRHVGRGCRCGRVRPQQQTPRQEDTHPLQRGHPPQTTKPLHRDWQRHLQPMLSMKTAQAVTAPSGNTLLLALSMGEDNLI